MRPLALLRALLLASLLLVAACGGDDEDVDAGAGDGGAAAGGGEPADGGAAGGTSPALPDRPADMVGEITSVTPFEPVTEDCVPPGDADPDEPVSDDDPPVCTPEDHDVLGTVVVEEQPGVQEGRKISYTVTVESTLAADQAAGSPSFDDLEPGQQVETWVAGDVCAESYPEQCGLEALRVLP